MNMNTNNINDENEISFSRLIRILLLQSKFVITIIILGSSLGIGNYLLSEKTYKTTSLIQIQNYAPERNFGTNLTLDLYLGDSSSTSLMNFEDIYKSRSLILDVIENKKINISSPQLNYFEKDNLIETFKIGKSFSKTEFEINLKENSYEITDVNSNQVGVYDYGTDNTINNAKINLNKISKKGVIRLIVDRPENIYNKIAKRFSINSMSKVRSPFQQTGLLEISFISNDLDEAIDVLNFGNNNYINNNIEKESLQARQALDFIDLQISNVSGMLDVNKSSLKSFREENKSVNVDKEIELIIDSLKEIEVEIAQLEVEISIASSNYTAENPFYRGLISQSEILQSRKRAIEEKIKELPLAQQRYIDLYNNIQIQESALSQLTNKRLEYSIREASTLGNITIIDSAYFDAIVSPRLLTVVLFIVFSTLLAFSLAILRGLYFLPISNPAELPDNGINLPIIGVLPKDEEANSDANDNDDSVDSNLRFRNSIESLLVNIKNIKVELNTPATTLLVTSPTAENGKSFVSRTIAKSLSKLGKKTILLDFDFKRGDQAKAFGSNKISKKEFTNINLNNIENYKIDEFLYVIPKISKLSNSFQFIYTAEFLNVLDNLKNNFDYVIMDTAPLLSVSDTSTLLSMSDINLMITRHSKSKLKEIRQAISISEQLGIEMGGLIYNFYERPENNYGYYGLYGDYKYEYYAQRYLYKTYDYKDE